MTILITGGAGYIGSHTAALLLEQGHRVVIVDNLSNSHRDAVENVERAVGKSPVLYTGDIRDEAALDWILEKEAIDAVMHFAGLKSPGQSLERPFDYYDNNVLGTYTLCKSMAKHRVKRLIFSSSAAVYGGSAASPIGEEAPLAPASPYGRTKMMCEAFLRDLAAADPEWRVIVLRYFNPIGAHESGLMGENPKEMPDNLMPGICRVAGGDQRSLPIFGSDYPTPDGTGIRDYIHVMDLARGHARALDALAEGAPWEAYNLGRGEGCSVLEIVRGFEAATGTTVPYSLLPRRTADVAVSYTDPAKAARLLGWQAAYSLEDMCRHAWEWHIRNNK